MKNGQIEDEKSKKLAELRTLLRQKIKKAENNLEDMQTMLELVNEKLIAESFKRPEMPKKIKSIQTTELQSEKYESTEFLKTAAGSLLATLNIGKKILHIETAEDKIFNINTPPFKQFLLNRVLEKMRDKDLKSAELGKITPEKVISYELDLDGETIKGLLIKNTTPERARELKSSIHWTLEKMYEKQMQ